MFWAGSVQCPNCQSPIDSEASICPYCYSSSPHTAPWQVNRFGQWWLAYVLIFAVFAVIVISDGWFGTTWLPKLLEALKESD